jgi:hypothetical protein
MCASTPASYPSIVAADYQSFGEVDFGGALHTSFGSDAYTEITLNSDGLVALNSAVGGTFIIGLLEGGYDLADVEHWYNAYKYVVLSGIDYPPTLIVTYVPLIDRANNIKDLTPLELLRNVEMSASGKFYVDNQGRAVWESRFKRNP